MKLKLFTLITLFTLVVGIGLRGPAAVAAQDTSDSDIDLSSLKGLDSAVGRTYIGDMDAMIGAMSGESTPGASPDLSSLGLFSITGVVAKFDNSSNAKAALKPATDAFTQSLQAGDSGSEVELKDAKVSGVGSDAKAYSGTMESEGIALNFFMIITQNNNYLYVSVAISFGDDAKAGAVDFTKALINTKASKGDGTFDENGKSTGGLWDKFPKDGDKALKGLTAGTDEIFYPTPEE